MPTNYTEHYALSQWEPGDKVQRTDFNTDNAKIDMALTAQAQTLAAHTQALSKLSNCRVHLTSYTGDGVCQLDHSPRIPLPEVPNLLIIFGTSCWMYHQPEAGGMAYITSGRLTGFFGVKWEGSTAILEQHTSNDSSYMNNTSKYYVLAFYQAQ